MIPASRRSVWVAIVVALLAAIPFLPTLRNGFVSWDDDKNFLTNPAYRGLGWEQIQWMWTTFHLGHYVPLSWMTLGLDYSLWGMDARGYHLTSLVIHAANAALVYLVARRLLGLALATKTSELAMTLGAALAALWFAVHPLRVESVAWVTERRDVLSGLLFSASVLLYLASVDADGGSRRRYWTAVVMFALALLSKATAMTLPAVLLLLNVYPLQRLSLKAPSKGMTRRVVAELAPFAVLSVGAMLLSIVALSPGEQLGLIDKLAVSAHGLTFYLWKTVVPTGLAPYYPLPGDLQAGAPEFVVAYFAVVALAVVAWKLRRRAPGAVVAITAFVVMVLPMLGVVQNGPQLAADRYTYHAAPALALLAGGAFATAWRRRRISSALAGASLLAFLSALTWRQTTVWRDSHTLWSRVLEVSDDAAIGHNAMGNVLLAQDNVSQALARFERAVELDPSFAEAYNNLGVTLARLGRHREASEQFQRAISLKPDYDAAHTNWGVALGRTGEWPAAIDHFRRALAINDRNAEAEVNWGNALVRTGATEDAIPHYRRAVELQPDLATAHANWGAALARLGRWAEAITQFRTALAVDSSDTETRSALERALAMDQRPVRRDR